MADKLKGTNNRGGYIITTRDYRETIIARIKREPKFARLLCAGAVEMMSDGEFDEGLFTLRDLINARITFKVMARQTGLAEKSLRRMLSRDGNPSARNFRLIIKSVAEDLGIKLRVEFA